MTIKARNSKPINTASDQNIDTARILHVKLLNSADVETVSVCKCKNCKKKYRLWWDNKLRTIRKSEYKYLVKKWLEIQENSIDKKDNI